MSSTKFQTPQKRASLLSLERCSDRQGWVQQTRQNTNSSVPPQMHVSLSCFAVPSRVQWLPKPAPCSLPRRPYLNDAPPRPPHGCGHVLVRFVVQAEGRRRLDSVNVSQKCSPLRLLLHRHLFFLALEISETYVTNGFLRHRDNPEETNLPLLSSALYLSPLLQS